MGTAPWRVGWEQGPITNSLALIGIATVAVSLSAVFLLHHISRRKVPDQAKQLLVNSRRKWDRELFIHYDAGYMMPFMGLLAEYLFLSVSPWFFFLPPAYLGATIFVYLQVRERTVSRHWIVLFAFFASWSSSFFSCVALSDLELLARVFKDFGINTQTSRSISLLFFPWTQCGLVLSSALMIAHTWRSRLLLRSGLDIRDLQDTFDPAMEKNSSKPWASELIEVFSELPQLLDLFEQGNFPTVVALGWGMVDRGLSLVSPDKKMKGRALDLGLSEQEFDACYGTRNKMVHEGRRPTHRDALSLLLLVKHLLVLLCDVEQHGRE
jgi:hypothetical protein